MGDDRVVDTRAGIVASHYPVRARGRPADPDAIVLVSHVGRPDERCTSSASTRCMVISRARTATSRPAGTRPSVVPTWNHVTAHLCGTPEILSRRRELPRARRARRPLRGAHARAGHASTLDEEGSRRIAAGTVGIRLRVERFDARAKLSQNKAPEVVDRIVAELEGDGHYAQPALAAEMRRVHGRCGAARPRPRGASLLRNARLAGVRRTATPPSTS